MRAGIDSGTRLQYNRIMKKIAVAGGIAVAAAIIVIILYVLPVQFSTDKTTDALASDAAVRGALTAAMAALAALYCKKKLFALKPPAIKELLWLLPCLAVALANFPYSALACGSAEITRTDLIWLFLLKCLLIAASEELLFRGTLFAILRNLLQGKKHSFVLSALISSVLFALFHLIALFEGADAGSVLLQTGYTFLTGLMFACVTHRTGNIWAAIALHFIFDAGGLIVPDIGAGSFQDTIFIIQTAICGAVCAAHLIAYAIFTDRREKLQNSDC